MTHPTQAAAYLRPGFVLVPNHVAGWIHRHTNLDQARINARGEDLVIDGVLIALRHAALTSSGSGTTQDPASADTAPSSQEELTVQEAADMLRITERAVRLACTRGRLHGTHRAGRWFLTLDAIHDYASARRAAA